MPRTGTEAAPSTVQSKSQSTRRRGRGQRAAQGPAQPSGLPGLGEIPAILRIREIDHPFPLLSCKGHSGLASSCVHVPREGDRFRGSRCREPRSKCGKGLGTEKLPARAPSQS